MGSLLSTSGVPGGRRIRVRSVFDAAELATGESIAVNGVCLTVVDIRPESLSFDVSPETLGSTTLGSLRTGAPVNLERAMRMDSRFGGHLVSGHVDGVGRVEAVEPAGEFNYYRISAPEDVVRVSIPKGSVTVDGISLTIVALSEKSLTVAIIPHTAKATTMGTRLVGDEVNLEADMIGKYVARLLSPRVEKKSLMGLLEEEGFIR